MTNRDKLVGIERNPCQDCGVDWCPDCCDRYWAWLESTFGVSPNWRDARTDPPNSDEDVLLCFSNGTMVVGGLREDGGWYSNADAEWYTDCESVPEKWQPLP